MEEKRNRRGLIAVCLLVLSLVLITVGTTFALFQYSRKGTTENTLHTGTLTFVYDEKRAEKNGVKLTNAFPISDEEGKVLAQDNNEVFDFEVRAKTSGAPINYEIYLTNEDSTLPEYVVKTYLRTVSGGESDPETTGLPTGTNLNLYSALYDSKVPEILKKEIKGKTLYRETISSSGEEYIKTFRYRMWIDEDANKVINGSWKYNSKIFSVKVNVYAQNETITEPTKPDVYKDESGANYPELVEGLIPVRYDTNKKSWVKADLYKEWYDYNNQEWANAVTVKETGTSNRTDYMSAKAGTPISMEDINTMWVWIPRYEYNFVSIQTAEGEKETCLNNSSVEFECYPKPGAIEMHFVNEKSKTVSDINNYKMHPAFTFGNDELTGFWYGKFETNSKEQCTASNDMSISECNNNELTPQIKPGVTSWRGISISNAFYAALSMNSTKASIYGFSSDEIDTHMSKNSEWGAVAYLSQSKYGKYGNDMYGENDKEVYINNCSSYITGIAGDTADAEASSETCERNTYETLAGQKASTTGNITGIYDMNGGSLDYVMGVLSNEQDPAKPIISRSEFVDGEDGNKLPEAKYYDLYISNDTSSRDVNLSKTACDKGVCYGHALSETSGWYGDYQEFICLSDPWFFRGGYYDNGSIAGVNFSGTYQGVTNSKYSFRLVLAPIK